MPISVKTVRKAVFTVAAPGKCFLPTRKPMQKEILPTIKKPAIQYAVEEKIEARVTDRFSDLLLTPKNLPTRNFKVERSIPAPFTSLAT